MACDRAEHIADNGNREVSQRKGENILLVGMMGVGKTAVGRSLARELDWDFFDVDNEMEQVTGLKLKNIYLKYGEIRFRSEEALVMRRTVAMERTVISTGGSLPISSENRALIAAGGYVVWLKAEPETVCRRVKRKQDRLLLPRGATDERIFELVAERNPEFEALADLTLEVESYDVDGLVTAILKGWRSRSDR